MKDEIRYPNEVEPVTPVERLYSDFSEPVRETPMATITFFDEDKEYFLSIPVVSRRVAYVKRIAMKRAKALYFMPSGSWRHTHGSTYSRDFTGTRIAKRRCTVVIDM